MKIQVRKILVRITVFDRKGSALIDFRLPSDISSGDYTVSVTTKPGTKYFTASIDQTVAVA